MEENSSLNVMFFRSCWIGLTMMMNQMQWKTQRKTNQHLLLQFLNQLCKICDKYVDVKIKDNL